MVSYSLIHSTTVLPNILLFYTFIVTLYYFRVEKYRPNSLDDLISHEDIIQTSNIKNLIHYSKKNNVNNLFFIIIVGKFIKEDQLPHLLFYGPPGTGKTSTILACAKQLYTPAQFRSMVGAFDSRLINFLLYNNLVLSIIYYYYNMKKLKQFKIHNFFYYLLRFLRVSRTIENAGIYGS